MHNLTHIRWAGSFALFAAAFATGLEIERAERDRMTRCESGPTAENNGLDSTLPLKIIFLSNSVLFLPGSGTEVLSLLGPSQLVTLR